MLDGRYNNTTSTLLSTLLIRSHLFMPNLASSSVCVFVCVCIYCQANKHCAGPLDTDLGMRIFSKAERRVKQGL